MSTVVSDMTISNPAGTGAGFGDNLFFGSQMKPDEMKLMASTMLSAAIKRQYSSVLSLLRHCLPVLTKFVERQWIFCFFLSGYH